MQASGIITLLTDFGIIDEYVSMMKGVIISINPRAKIFDITHQVNAGLIIQAAHIIKDTYTYYPKGSVHVVVIDPGVGSDRRSICVEAGGHFFVGPDNGLFWPIIKDNEHCRVINITNHRYFLSSVSNTFHGRDVFAPVAAHISKGVTIDEFGNFIADPVELSFPRSVKREDSIIGQVIKVDNFGNLISNISEQDLDSVFRSKDLKITIRDQEIRTIHNNYSEVDTGELLALINSSNMLEIAVCLGRASEYIGLNRGELIGAEVRVEKLD